LPIAAGNNRGEDLSLRPLIILYPLPAVAMTGSVLNQWRVASPRRLRFDGECAPSASLVALIWSGPSREEVNGPAMRTVLIVSLGLLVGACSSISDVVPLEARPQPNADQVSNGIASGTVESHFAKPVEVTDLLRAPPNSVDPWIVCIRSSASDEARRSTYSVFIGVNPSDGKDGQYTRSRYSSITDNCTAQKYHSHE
jgi:hypothetical protein